MPFSLDSTSVVPVPQNRCQNRVTAIQAKILKIISNQVRWIRQNKPIPVMKSAILEVSLLARPLLSRLMLPRGLSGRLAPEKASGSWMASSSRL